MRPSLAAAVVLVLAMAVGPTPVSPPAPIAGVVSTIDVLRQSGVLTATERAADYYRRTLAHTTAMPNNNWSWATYANGVQALYRQSGDVRYLRDGMAWGRSNGWQLVASAESNPDLIKAAQTYYDLHGIDPRVSLRAADAVMSAGLTSPVSRYWWIDTLFMGLPDQARWAARTGDTSYLDKLDSIFTWVRDGGATSSVCAGKAVARAGLFDPTQGLWYRDCRFIGAKDARGLPVFWARGNGWVIAAMAQVLDAIPAGDLRAAKYARMLATMAASLIRLQGSDGLWRSNLTDSAMYPQPETSGTSLISYALSYGVKAGILDSATYLPVIVRAWKGLAAVSLQPNGFVTNCQPAGSGPAAPYSAKAPREAPNSISSGTVNSDSPPFCVGSFLLAGTEIAQLVSSPPSVTR